MVDYSGSGARGVVLMVAERVERPKPENRLTSLDISHNHIGAEGGTALALALPSCPKLTMLNIGCKSISLASDGHL